MLELDLRLEAAACSELSEPAAETGLYKVPEIHWSLGGKNVMVTQWIDGTALSDDAILSLPQEARTDIARKVMQSFLACSFDYGVFHADMHEGNMIVLPDGRLGLIDFGIIGRIGMDERRFLAEILWGFIKRDYQRIAQVHFDAGYVPADKSVGDFAQALRSVGEPIHGKDASEVSMGKLLLQLFDFTHQFGMHLRPELVLLQKTMVQVEGVARSIDPNHDIWTAAEPGGDGLASFWVLPQSAMPRLER